MYSQASYQLTTGALRLSHQAPSPSIKRQPLTVVALTKRAERFLSSLANNPTNSSIRLINKFVASSPKSIALDALSHLLSPPNDNSSVPRHLALPLYLKITETIWFEWNPKLAAQLIALLHKLGLTSESEALISESISKLRRSKSERDVSLFYCYLLESHSSHGSVRGFNESYANLSQLVHRSNSVYVKRQGFKSMVKGLCEMGRPREAEDLLSGGKEGMEPSMYEFRCVLYGYGMLGLLEDMERVFELIGERAGLSVDTVSFNMMLSCYGAHNALDKMVVWVRTMKELAVPLSLRTCNTVFNACPTIKKLLGGDRSAAHGHGCCYPVSFGGLVEMLQEDEAVLVEELAGCALVLEGVMKWDDLEGKLELHGMHLGTAYVVILEWMEEMRRRIGSRDRKHVVPVEVTVVCGLGNHSSVRGESPVKCLVKDMMTRTGSPMRIDRKNRGCFVAKGKLVEEWIRTLQS